MRHLSVSLFIVALIGSIPGTGRAAGRSLDLRSAPAGSIVGWGDNAYNQLEAPAGTDYVAVAAGAFFGVGLRSNGTLVGWGRNDDGEATPPSGNTYVAVAAGAFFGVALKSDGSLVAWGKNDYGQATPPSGKDYIAVAAGGYHGLALKSDHSIVGWGRNDMGQAGPFIGSDYVAMSGGGFYSIGLRSGGTITHLTGVMYAPPPTGSGFVSIQAGYYHALAVHSNGSVAAWGTNNHGQATAPSGNDFVAAAPGDMHSVALRSDGSIHAWGLNANGQAMAPSGNRYLAVAAGQHHSLALSGYSVRAIVSGGIGTASPAAQAVGAGGAATITITPDAGYQIESIFDNGVAKPVTTSYAIDNIHEDHTIVIGFAVGCTPPSITTNPQDQTIPSGLSATLSVLSGGTGPLHYQWYQGANPDSQPVGSDADTYATGPLTTTTSFWVHVWNDCGQADSIAAVVTVTPASSVTITRITSRTGRPGDTATIRGKGFAKSLKQNAVYFGTSKAKIKSAKATILKVQIPKKCPKGPVGVRAVVNGEASNILQFVVK